MINWKKPIQARFTDNEDKICPARLICSDFKNEQHKKIVLIDVGDDEEFIFAVPDDGVLLDGHLENCPETMFVVLAYNDSGWVAMESLERTEDHAKEYGRYLVNRSRDNFEKFKIVEVEVQS